MMSVNGVGIPMAEKDVGRGQGNVLRNKPVWNNGCRRQDNGEMRGKEGIPFLHAVELGNG